MVLLLQRSHFISASAAAIHVIWQTKSLEEVKPAALHVLFIQQRCGQSTACCISLNYDNLSSNEEKHGSQNTVVLLMRL